MDKLFADFFEFCTNFLHHKQNGKGYYYNRKLKGCICYFFASLFCKSIGKHLRNMGKYFYFSSEALSVLKIIQILTFLISKCHDAINNTKHILLNNLGNKHSPVTKFRQPGQPQTYCYRRLLEI